MGIGVGPVIMPGYLDRTQIVTRTGADQVELATFHRWAEPLETGSPGSSPRRSAPASQPIGSSCSRGQASSPETIQYQVVVAVHALRWSHSGGDVTLDTRWRILGRDGDELAFRRSTVTEAAAGSGYEPMVAAMTRALVPRSGDRRRDPGDAALAMSLRPVAEPVCSRSAGPSLWSCDAAGPGGLRHGRSAFGGGRRRQPGRTYLPYSRTT